MSSIAPEDQSGAEWLLRCNKSNETINDISLLGIRVADFLGYLYAGIYHISKEVLHERVDWANERWIEVTVSDHGLSTWDFNWLTMLVFLAHHFCLRVQLSGAAPGYIRFAFSPRCREGGMSHRHPTLIDAVASFRKLYDFLEITEDHDPWLELSAEERRPKG